jgi:prevent-host-death family protein
MAALSGYGMVEYWMSGSLEKPTSLAATCHLPIFEPLIILRAIGEDWFHRSWLSRIFNHPFTLLTGASSQGNSREPYKTILRIPSLSFRTLKLIGRPTLTPSVYAHARRTHPKSAYWSLRSQRSQNEIDTSHVITYVIAYQGGDMTTLTATEARKQLYTLLDNVSESHEPIQITGKRHSAVLISESDWKAVQETLYLSSIPGMSESIKAGLAESVENCDSELDW